MQRSASTIAGYIKDFHAPPRRNRRDPRRRPARPLARRDQQPRPRAAPATHPSRPRTPPPGRHPRSPHRSPPTPRPPSLRRTERRLDPQPRSLRRTRRNPDQERPLGRPHPARSLLADRPLPQRTKPTSCRQFQALPTPGPRAVNARRPHSGVTSKHSNGTPRSDPKQPRKTLDQTHQNHPISPIKPDQTRTNPITIANDPQQNKANPEPNAENQRKIDERTHLSRPNYPRGPGPAALDTPPAGTTPAATSPDATSTPPSSRNSSAAP